MKINEQIRTLRKSSGVSLRELEARTGMNYTYLSRIETGNISPSVDVVERMCEALGAAMTIKKVGE